jgi:uncharacterized protein (TIGR02266 family)
MAKYPDRRVHERRPIRLQVGYRTAHSLVTEYTRSISKGGCLLELRHPVAIGTLFIFEMSAPGLPDPVEVQSRVVRVDPPDERGLYPVALEYIATSEEKRRALDSAIDRIFAEQERQGMRRHPRIPVNLLAQDSRLAGRRYLVRDLSLGGMGIRMPDFGEPPPEIRKGTPVLIAIEAGGEKVDLSGEVVWIQGAGREFEEVALGIRFDWLAYSEHALVELLTRLARPQAITFTFLAGSS